MIRKPIVSGLFYEDNKERLTKQIKACIKHELGPKDTEYNQNIIAAIAPHAGYTASGPCACHTFKALSSQKPDTIIIFGTNHTGLGSGFSKSDWETPLGIIECDKEFLKIIEKNTTLKHNKTSHQQEHSIEVQLPMIQHFIGSNIKIVPITICQDIDTKEIAEKLVKCIKESGKNIIILASSDFTHYGPNYGYVPFINKIKERVYQLDNKLINYILKFESDKFIEYVNQTKATVCGKYPILLLLEIMKNMEIKNADLLKYYTSGDISGDFSNCVGYASIIFIQ